jgi:uncharacterized RDD family membrane protein YckC
MARMDRGAGSSTVESADRRIPARIGARVIDALLLGALGGALGVAMDFDVVWLMLQASLVFTYFVVCDVAWGTTIGKRLLGLEVVGPTGGRPDIRQAGTREAFTLLGAIPFAGPVLALIAWIVILVTANASPTGQGKHDELAGGTRVLAVG